MSIYMTKKLFSFWIESEDKDELYDLLSKRDVPISRFMRRLVSRELALIKKSRGYNESEIDENIR